MTDLSKTLALTKVAYRSEFKYKYDPSEKVWIGTIKNSDLVVVIKNPSKEKLAKELQKAAEMHCYMFSMEAISMSLDLLNSSVPETKPACNILVPEFA